MHFGSFWTVLPCPSNFESCLTLSSYYSEVICSVSPKCHAPVAGVRRLSSEAHEQRCSPHGPMYSWWMLFTLGGFLKNGGPKSSIMFLWMIFPKKQPSIKFMGVLCPPYYGGTPTILNLLNLSRFFSSRNIWDLMG